MLNELAKIWEDGGRLVGVRTAILEADQQFVTALELRFESLTAVFRADAEYDTLTLSFGGLEQAPEESLSDQASYEPWSACVGHDISWAWKLTNQQGYDDGVRFEFGEPDGCPRIIVELIVSASSIQLYVSNAAP